MQHESVQHVSVPKKRYASQESIGTTLTQAELAAPFAVPPPDPEPLPRVTRSPVLADDSGIVASGLRDVLAAAGGGA